MNKLISASMAALLLSNIAYGGLPFIHHHKSITTKKKSHVMLQDVNFSGKWIGKCDGDQNDQNTSEIIQNGDSFIMGNGQFMQEFLIDGSTSNHESSKNTTDNHTMILTWNDDHSAVNFYSFYLDYGAMVSMYYARSQMRLEDGKLIVEGKSVSSVVLSDDFKTDSFKCIYTKQE